MRQPEAKTPQLREVMLLYCVIVPAHALSNGGILTGNKLMLWIYGRCALLYAATLIKGKKSYLFVMFALIIFSLISYNTYTHIHLFAGDIATQDLHCILFVTWLIGQ